uniref:Symplekin C-terminal domain-containing protein n=1 Tax=Globisporangium ultimum (strain ATCC 200006 / CBS 805.95 / DAOM BR144) TaxID=431595 RepID=K3X403_GLOUD
MELPALEREVLALLGDVPTSGSNADQCALFQRVQELVFHRDPSGDAHALLHAAMPFMNTLAQHQNAALVTAVLQFLTQAAKRSAAFLRDVYDVSNTLLMLSFTTEKNVLSAIQLALSSLSQAFLYANDSNNDSDVALIEQKRALWSAVTTTVEQAMEIVATAPLAPIGGASDANNNNRSALVWLRTWKLLECAALLLSVSKDAAMYRDPARSNVQPDDVTLDRIASSAAHPVLEKSALEKLGSLVVERMCARLSTGLEASGSLGKREWCVALNSLALVAALRPHFMVRILPTLVALQNYDNSNSVSDTGVVHATLKANLVKLLSHPSAQAFADEVTECLIALGASERAFRAISNSKVPRRKYVTGASLSKTRIGKRSAQTMAERVKNDTNKRHRIGDGSSSGPNGSSSSAASASTTTGPPAAITHEGIVNMASSAVVNLVLESFASELPSPPPANLKLDLTPSELKTRMVALLARLATPSSVLAIENSNKRMRDPRRRRDPRVAAQLQQEQPALVCIFDDAETVDEVSDWISKNASSVAEPLISVTEDNVVQVFLKSVDGVWCREMAVAALARILENEYGVTIRGDEQLRESVLCRLASSPWLLLTDERNQPIVSEDPRQLDQSMIALPAVYETILAFVLEDYAVRSTLATALLYHEYTRFTTCQVRSTTGQSSMVVVPTDALYRKAVTYFLGTLHQKIDLSSASDKKLFGALVLQLPRITTEVLVVLAKLFDEPNGVVLGITVLRDLIKERAVSQTPALRMLLRYTCHDDEKCRNSSIRCVANQLYALESLKEPIEKFAIHLVHSLQTATVHDDQDEESKATDTVTEGDVEMEASATVATEAEEKAPVDTKVSVKQPAWLDAQLRAMQTSEQALATELLTFAAQHEQDMQLSKPVDNDESETLRRIELYLALCAKKPTLLAHVIAAYAHASESVRQVIFHAIEKLIKHLKQRGGTSNVVAQLHGFETNALGLVCHIIQILSVRTRSSSSSEDAAATEELVQQVLGLYHEHAQIPDSISVLIPILPSIRAETLFPLLPPLLALPPPRLSVAITKLLEAMPPQVVAPIDLLVALHHVDLRSEPAMQKKVIQAINLCVEHRHAFPSDVLLHVCRVLVQDEKISKLALRTLILSVTAYPNLQQDMTALLEILVERHVWEMEDALWKGFVKCAALIQPASFPLLLHKLPVAQLRVVLDDEPDLRALLCEFVKEEGGTGAAANLSAELRECIGLQHDATGGPDDAMNANVAEADEPSKQEEGDDVQN